MNLLVLFENYKVFISVGNKTNYFNDMVNLLDEIKKLEKRIEQLEEIINPKDKAYD